jgi:hypothetical protein
MHGNSSLSAIIKDILVKIHVRKIGIVKRVLRYKLQRSYKGTSNIDVRQWILFFPQTSAVPSSFRVSVWRRMQQLGAVTLQNGVWIFPQIAELERRVQHFLADLEAQGGSGYILTAQALLSTQEERLIERFRSERQQDYEEFLDRCERFLEELEKETKAEKFTFSELEENEEDFHKLKLWLRKIHARDFFGGAQRDTASEALIRCQQALKVYATQVYRQQGYDPPEDPGTDEETPARP